jgi:hypothetical protein
MDVMFLRVLARAGICLPSRCLAMDIHVTLLLLNKLLSFHILFFTFFYCSLVIGLRAIKLECKKIELSYVILS